MTSTCFPEVGQSIPDTPHAVSVSLPSWKANVGYEEGEDWVLGNMKNGYPRFFVHLGIRAFSNAIIARYGEHGETAMLFPSTVIATHCRCFIIAQCRASYPCHGGAIRIVDLVFQDDGTVSERLGDDVTMISAVLFPENLASIASKFWQHSGEGVSSRRAEFFHRALQEGHLVSREPAVAGAVSSIPTSKGPRRYRKPSLADVNSNSKALQRNEEGVSKIKQGVEQSEYLQFVEERFGRNLDMSLARSAKLAIRRRISGCLTAHTDSKAILNPLSTAIPTRHGLGFSIDDVYLYPTGMSAIYNTHRMMMSARGPLKSIMFGFPYIDTLKVLEKFGPGCLFYGHGSENDLDDLERRCMSGERFLALFCEFPGNPLLRTPNLKRVRSLADEYDFGVVVDETIGNFLNVHVLPCADVVVSSLTKIFSGDSNVMGGSCVLNPGGKYYQQLRAVLASEYEDNYWPEDAIFMERNSRDFVSRSQRINTNAEAVCQLLHGSRQIKKVYYPKYSPTKPCFEEFRHQTGGYGGLFSITFHSMVEAIKFYDALDTAKGPSLGTNFTLCSPFVILAHYGELDWAAQFGAEASLVRVSVGLEETAELCQIFQKALEAIAS